MNVLSWTNVHNWLELLLGFTLYDSHVETVSSFNLWKCLVRASSGFAKVTLVTETGQTESLLGYCLLIDFLLVFHPHACWERLNEGTLRTACKSALRSREIKFRTEVGQAKNLKSVCSTQVMQTKVFTNTKCVKAVWLEKREKYLIPSSNWSAFVYFISGYCFNIVALTVRLFPSFCWICSQGILDRIAQSTYKKVTAISV